MRITLKEQCKDRVLKVVCNRCRHIIPAENGIVLEDYLHIDKKWGYFSQKDGIEISFDLCEKCADELTKQLSIPAYEKEVHEYL